MLEILNAIANFFKNVGGFLGVDLISIIAFSLLVVIMFISALVANFSVESATNRKVKQINNYLTNNPFVTDENIVEFNRIMKHRMPRAMRYQWQRYMVNRDQKPSNYLTEDNCITKPFRTSAFLQALKQTKYAVGFLCVASFTLILGALFNNPTSVVANTSSVIEVLLKSLVTPSIIILVAFIFTSLMNAKRSAVLNELFYNFDAMQHALDRAVTTFPAFVDYEILFTRKEIAAGIPALQEYLQQRAQYEQEQLEKARLSQVEHESYDFSKLGVKGTLIMDRAMKECEFYLGNRKILLADIDNLQSQKDLLTKNFDEKNRNNQRKLRDVKETIDRLREKLNTTTNKIVGNDIIRQQADEVKKQQLIEKEMDGDNNNYNQELAKLEDQIAKKRKEIEDNKKLVENTLINDFKDYSDKIYDELKKIADSNVLQEIADLKEDKATLERELEDREKYIVEKTAMLDEKIKEAENSPSVQEEIKQLKQDLAVKNQEIIGANKEVESRALENMTLQREIERLKKEKYHEVYRYFDSNGVEFFYDDNGEPFFFDNEGRITYYTDAEKIKQLKSYKEIEEQIKNENQEQVVIENVNPLEEKQEKQDELPPVEAKESEEKVEEPVKDSSLSSDELAQLDNLEVVEQKPKEKEEVKPEEKADESAPKAEEIKEEAKPQEAVEEPKQETPAEEKPAEQTTNDEIKELEKAINDQNKELEQQYSKLQEQLQTAEKVVEEPIEKPVEKKETKKPATAKKKATSTKKPATKKASAKKPATKKASTTKSKSTKPKAVKKPSPAEKVELKEPVVRAPKKRKKDEFVFKVKKAPKTTGSGTDNGTGVDLSAFNEFADEDKNK